MSIQTSSPEPTEGQPRCKNRLRESESAECPIPDSLAPATRLRGQREVTKSSFPTRALIKSPSFSPGPQDRSLRQPRDLALREEAKTKIRQTAGSLLVLGDS